MFVIVCTDYTALRRNNYITTQTYHYEQRDTSLDVRTNWYLIIVIELISIIS